MIIVGDIHGEYEWLARLAKKEFPKKIVQIGDFGFGFREFPESFRSNLRFFPGNHDDPDAAIKHPNCLGRFGNQEDFFFISGADSIDKHDRIEGKDWWRNEELSYAEFQNALDLYEKVRPKIFLSHDGPQSVVKNLFGYDEKSFTRTALDAMLAIHEPELWIFGHHHSGREINIGRTKFICLKERGIYEN